MDWADTESTVNEFKYTNIVDFSTETGCLCDLDISGHHITVCITSNSKNMVSVKTGGEKKAADSFY